jgi:hypothetical protein
MTTYSESEMKRIKDKHAKKFADHFPLQSLITTISVVAVADKFNWRWQAQDLLSLEGHTNFCAEMVKVCTIFEETTEAALRKLLKKPVVAEELESVLNAFHATTALACEIFHASSAVAFATTYAQENPS